ncbi:MAG: DUF6178 family protein [Syntrophaceae bacterium]|nr:DUF6178 family protein [Syntrophaceae bacterium]
MENYDFKADCLKVIDQFNALTISQKVEIFGNLAPKAREDLIDFISRPSEIIRRISEEEMFFTIKDLGEENAKKLITFTTSRQLLYLLDIDLWTRNDLNLNSISKWFQILVSIGDEKILQFVQVCDPELLCSILNKTITVKSRNPDVDLTEQLDFLPPFTLDNNFFIDFKIHGIEDYVKNFLDCIFQYDSNYYFKIVQSLAIGWLPEYEDKAYKWRSARLADHGFPDFEEALNIYSLLNPSLIRDSGDSSSDFTDTYEPENTKYLRYPISVLGSRNLFERILANLEDVNLRDRINLELINVANKVMVADAKDSGSIESLRQSLKKTSAYINLALEEILSREDILGLDLIRYNHMEILFRHGHTLIMKLQHDARRFVSNCDGGIENLGLPLAPMLTGLFMKRPLFDPGLISGGIKREFQYLNDLEMIRSLIQDAKREENWEQL